jgi:putative transposase
LARAVSDAALSPKVQRVWADNYQVYGARKIWRQLHREGELVGRDRVARLMRSLGIAGVVRAKTHRTTVPDPAAARAPDLVQRQFTALWPNQLWVSDFTYLCGQLVGDGLCRLRHRRLLAVDCGLAGGHQHTHRAGPGRIGDGGLAAGQGAGGLVGHLDAGSQYTSIRYTDRLAEIGAAPSVGSVGDSYDNSLAESTIGLFKTELIRRRGPWRTVEEVDLATLAYVDWFNHRRLHSEIGHIPPAELEATYYPRLEATTAA